MDPQQHNQIRGRSPSVGAHPHTPHINRMHSPSPSPRAFNHNDVAASTIGLGLDLDGSSHQPDFSAFDGSASPYLTPQPGLTQDLAFDAGQPFTDQLNLPQPSFGEDFTIFPASSAEQISAPLFIGDGIPDMNTMAGSPGHHSPTPPHLLKPEPHQSPSFNTHQFSSPAGRHSRNASLGPEAALLPHQDWSQSQFQGHRRTPSEYSDVSSVGAHSPALVSSDNFSDQLEHSPMQRPQDAAVYQELHGISSFTISDQSPNRGRSPSHSPAISPRILPQSLPEMSQPGSFVLPSQNNGYGGQAYMQASEAFPPLVQTSVADMSQMGQMAAPTIYIEAAPVALRTGFEGKPVMDTDALIPPDQRGMSRRLLGSTGPAC